VPSSRLTPCTVKKTFEQVAAAGAHLIAQVKANQPTLHQRIAEICQSAAPVDQVRTTDQKRRSRDEIRLVEVFDPGAAACLDAAAEWADHVTAIVRVSRDTLKRITTTGLWEGTSHVAYFIADIALPASVCAQAIRGHWGIENRLHYVRDVSFREDDSRIRCNPGIFARLRSFAANILRFNSVQNMSNGRYRIALGGVEAMLSLRVM
jgi:predicted transposase YbfD/YdcC